MAQSREQQEVIRLLKEHGGKLERTKKHQIWKLPDGRSYAMPSSPSCSFAWKNSLADVKTFLKLHELDRGKPGARRPKKAKKKHQKLNLEVVTGTPVTREAQAAALSELLSMRDELPTMYPDVPAPIAALLQESENTRAAMRYLSPTPEPKSVWWKPWTWKMWQGVAN